MRERGVRGNLADLGVGTAVIGMTIIITIAPNFAMAAVVAIVGSVVWARCLRSVTEARLDGEDDVGFCRSVAPREVDKLHQTHIVPS